MQQMSLRRLTIPLGALLAFGASAVFVQAQPPERNGKQEAKQAAKPEFKTVEGVVSKFLFGPDEVIRGMLLEDGTRVMWSQDVTYDFSDILDIGDKVKVSGWLQKSTTGEPNLEISNLTNMTTGKTAKNPMAPPPPAKEKKTNDRARLATLPGQSLSLESCNGVTAATQEGSGRLFGWFRGRSSIG
jgi:hypothetical protein